MSFISLKVKLLNNLSLNFFENKLRNKGVAKVFMGVKDFTMMKKLKLILGNNFVGNDGSIFATLSNLSFIKSLYLDLSNNQLNKNDSEHFSRAMGNLKSLNHLALNFDYNKLG